MTWISFVKEYHSKHPNLTYKQAMQEAAKSYKGAGTTGVGVTGGKRTDGVKSARRKYAFEIPTQIVARDPGIPGGKRGRPKKGGMLEQSYSEQPTPIQRRYAGDDMVGGSLVVSRGEVFDTDEGVKKMEGGKKRGAGIGSSIAEALVDGLMGDGKKKRGGAYASMPVMTAPEFERKKGAGAMKGAGFFDDFGKGFIQGFTAPLKVIGPLLKLAAGKQKLSSKKGAGILSDVGQGLDDITSLLGLGKKKQAAKPSAKKGAGILSDVGQGLDDITSLLGLGKKKSRAKKGAGILSDVGQGLDDVVGMLGL